MVCDRRTSQTMSAMMAITTMAMRNQSHAGRPDDVGVGSGAGWGAGAGVAVDVSVTVCVVGFEVGVTVPVTVSISVRVGRVMVGMVTLGRVIVGIVTDGIGGMEMPPPLLHPARPSTTAAAARATGVRLTVDFVPSAAGRVGEDDAAVRSRIGRN